MSPEVIAALLGVTVGVVVERLVRLLGLLRFEPSKLSLNFIGSPGGWGNEQSVAWEHASEATPADKAEYTFAFDLFNGKEVPTGLRDVRVELIRDDDQPPIKNRPVDLEADRLREMRNRSVPVHTIPETLDVLNLPPRQFVRKELRGTFDKEAAEAIRISAVAQYRLRGRVPLAPDPRHPRQQDLPQDHRDRAAVKQA